MKKIAILTFHNTNNYGAVLQTYALQKTLSDIKADAGVLNYLCPFIERQRTFNFKGYSAFHLIKKIIKIPFQMFIEHKFKFFRDQFFNIIKIDKNRDLNNEFDVFLVGSDQVWNYALTNNDPVYFLDFVRDKRKKNSYAASFGIDSIADEYKLPYKRLLSEFYKISVREKQAQNIIKDLLNIDVPVVLDPTFLLSKYQWQSIAVPKREKFVLLYLIKQDKKIIDFAEDLAKKKKLKLIYLSTAAVKVVKAEYIRPTPQEWLGYFLSAEYIVTNSFHGLAFSINFQKSFFVDLFPPSSIDLNSRLENILDLFDLRGRLIDNIGNDYDQPVNYDSVGKILETEREESINYLKEIIK